MRYVHLFVVFFALPCKSSNDLDLSGDEQVASGAGTLTPPFASCAPLRRYATLGPYRHLYRMRAVKVSLTRVRPCVVNKGFEEVVEVVCVVLVCAVLCVNGGRRNVHTHSHHQRNHLVVVTLLDRVLVAGQWNCYHCRSTFLARRMLTSPTHHFMTRRLAAPGRRTRTASLVSGRCGSELHPTLEAFTFAGNLTTSSQPALAYGC
jgi:hypothetical protein